MTERDPAAELAQIAEEVRVCTACELCRTRTNAVPGEGNENARILLIGEAPGHNEDLQGKPFVGQSGKFLTELLGKAGVSREDVFITNVVKCRPPGNRDPLPDEVAACSQYLQRQIAAIDPGVIVTLGRHSMARWFPDDRISKIHGQPRKVGTRTMVPMYHPAAGLHQGAIRPTIEEDFTKLPRILAEALEEREAIDREPETPAEQMNLF